MAQTAVEWLIHQLNTRQKPLDNSQIDELFEKAKEIEEQHIIKAWNAGYESNDIDEKYEINQSLFSAIKYYNETYKK